MKRFLPTLLASLLVVSATLADHQAAPARTLVLKNREGAAVLGYDPVAYFTIGRPTKGDPRFKSAHEGATYLFANAEHQALFKANPARYAPAYGGYCGYAASVNRLSPINPDWWQIVDGRLVLQHNRRAFDLFNNVSKADGNWPGLVARNGVAGGRALVFLNRRGVALDGYDPVSYFVDGRPAKGNRAIEATFHGALYHFVSEAHREMFEKDPARFAPAYGGYCGYAASIGKVRPASPRLWSIVDGQLVVQHTRGAVTLWQKDVAGNKTRADANWPRLIEAKAGQKNPIDSLLGRSVLEPRPVRPQARVTPASNPPAHNS
jgi:YHS domain-containing protein